MKTNSIKSIKMLSLDTATRHTGYALFKNGRYEKSGCLSVKSEESDPVDKMLTKISSLLKKYKPNIIVVEDTMVPRNAKVQRDLTEILGAIRFWCVENNSFYYAIKPTEWRKLVKSPDESIPTERKGLKNWAKQKSQKYTHKYITYDDESDAILIGQAYINLFENSIFETI